MTTYSRRPQVSILGSAEPGSAAYERAAEAGALLAGLGITVVSGCGSPATRVAAEQAIAAGGTVLSIVPPDEMPSPDWPATVVVPCGMGDARNLSTAFLGRLHSDRWPSGNHFRSLLGVAAQAPATAAHWLRGLVRDGLLEQPTG